MKTTDALKKLREAIHAGDPEAIETSLAEAERLAAVVPEIAVYMEGGLAQEISRANDAPYVLYIHDHDVEGTTDSTSLITWPGNLTGEAVLSTHRSDQDRLEDTEAFWESLRNPVIVEEAPDNDLDDQDLPA